MQEPSIFTKIIRGEIPCHKICEDEHTLAFLDINPVAEGHILVIPKAEVEFVWDLDDDSYAALMRTVKKVATRLRDVIGKAYVSEMVVGTDVPHAHVHVVAFNHADELKAILVREEVEPNHEMLQDIADRLAF